MIRPALLLLSLLLSAARADDLALYDAIEGSRLDEADRKVLAELEGSGRNALPGGAWRPGEVVFEYGTGHHSVVCAVLELCDIALEPGEKILDAQIGDSARWSVDTASSGSGGTQVSHLVVKPLASGIRTSLVVTTDRRAYHLRLKASPDQYMPSVRFSYPGRGFSALSSAKALQAQSSRQSAVVPSGRIEVDGGYQERAGGGAAEAAILDEEDMHDSDYEITGDEEAMPERVFFDGRRTIVRMARGTARMPVLLLSGGANYRVSGTDYIIDGRIAAASLVLTDGGETYRTEISHVG